MNICLDKLNSFFPATMNFLSESAGHRDIDPATLTNFLKAVYFLTLKACILYTLWIHAIVCKWMTLDFDLIFMICQIIWKTLKTVGKHSQTRTHQSMDNQKSLTSFHKSLCCTSSIYLCWIIIPCSIHINDFSYKQIQRKHTTGEFVSPSSCQIFNLNPV